MSAIDNRIVSVKFDNADFNTKIAATLAYLDKLKTSMTFSGSSKGLDDLQNSANRFNLSGLGGSVDGVSAKFVALSTVAVATLAHITTQAVDAGARLVKSLSLAPVMAGFHEYETNLNAIQTVLANTQSQGTTLKDVNKSLNELNTYSDKTIYNFSEMAKNIGTFTAAGVSLDASTAAIKGIANLAAVSGSTADQASTAMYQLSQAIANNKVGLQDWNSVVNAGMGGKVFQEALFNTAKQMHTITNVPVTETFDQWSKAGNSFRDSLKDGWITGKVLTNTLSQFTGDLTDAQLKAQGYNATQIKQIQAQAKAAQDAATKVKTMSQLVDTLKEAMGSGWTTTWQLIFGDFDEAKKSFTGLSNYFGGMIQSSANARNNLLRDFKKIGGRTVLIDGLKNAFEALLRIITPIKDAFRDIFPRRTAKDLYDLTVKFRDFAKMIQIGGETTDNLRRTFRGIFAIFSILKEVVTVSAQEFAHLFTSIGGGNGAFLALTARVGDFLVKIDAMLKDRDGVHTFFSTIAQVVQAPLAVLSRLAAALATLFGNFDTGKAKVVTDSLDQFGQKLSPLKAAGQEIKSIFHSISVVIAKAGAAVGSALVKMEELISTAFSGQTFKGILDTINTGLFAALVLSIKKFLKGGINIGGGGGGFFGGIKDTLNAVNDTLGAMQANLKANALIKIAGALALLTASIVVLATLNPKQLAQALTAIAVGFVGMQAALSSLSKSIGLIGTAKLPLLTTSMILLGGALVLMATALKIMASIKPEDTGRSLLNLAAMLLIVTKTMKSLSKDSAGMISAATALGILSGALIVMALALKLLATLSFTEMARGLTALAGTLVILAVTMKLMPKNMIAQAAALTILAGALNAIGLALKIFSTMSFKDMARGLTAMASSLAIIALAMTLMPKDMLLQSIALVAVAGALVVLSGAIKVMGSMGWESIGKGMTVLAGSMLILAVGLNAMDGALPGAAAMVVVAAALAVLTPVIVTLGTLEWATIIKSLVALAGIFLIIGAAGLALAPVTPVIIGLGAAMVLLGAGLALAGVGALAFATAFGIVVGAGAAGVQTLADILGTFINAIPAALAAFGAGIVALAAALAKGGPQFFAAFSAILASILRAIIVNVPLIGQAFLTLITTGLAVLVKAVPRMASAGLQIILGVLGAISSNIYRMVVVAGQIIVNFLNGLSSRLPSIIDAGVKLIISFINGVSKAIDQHSEELGRAGGRLAVAIVEGMAKGIAAGAGEIGKAAEGLAKHALSSVGGFLGIHSPSREFHKLGVYSSQGLAQGLESYSGQVADSATSVAEKALTAIRNTMTKVTDAVNTEVDPNPVIAPVIDLSQFRKDASQISGLLNVPPVSASVSYGQAASISADQQAAEEAYALQATGTEPTVFKFEQNNYSPEALSTADIYRQTNNQLSLAKKAAGIP